MKIIRDAQALRRWTAQARASGGRLALVPTMGALHAGHLSLVEMARKQAEFVVVSIYVNPAQFGPHEDLSRYPRPLEKDLAACRRAGVSAVFVPETLYEPDHSTWIEETATTTGGEGTQRPGHFRGVATVVLKLFHLVQPDVAVFGQKDAQQLQLIRRMVRDLDVPVKIVAGEIVRDADGLALSSRNVYLSEEERTQALALPLLLRAATLQAQPVRWLEKTLGRQKGLTVDYVESRDGRLCAAVRAGRTRLLDNVPLPSRRVGK
jgi:pantoate--beta-alanine ligase